MITVTSDSCVRVGTTNFNNWVAYKYILKSMIKRTKEKNIIINRLKYVETYKILKNPLSLLPALNGQCIEICKYSTHDKSKTNIVQTYY